MTQRLAIGTDRLRNLNVTGVEIGNGSARDITVRTDFVATGPASLTFEGGAQVQAQHRDEVGRELAATPGLPVFVVTSHDGEGTLSSAYAQARWAGGSRVA